MTHLHSMLSKGLILFILCLFTLPVMARDIYLDASKGKDTNRGTKSSPLQTISKALTVAKAGDTIYLQPGTYAGHKDRLAPGKHLFQKKYVTIAPAPGVQDPTKSVVLGRLSYGNKKSNYIGKDKRGTFDLFLRIKDLKLEDGFYVYGARNFEVIGCRIERKGPWHEGKLAMNAGVIERVAAHIHHGTNVVVKDCEITMTGGGITMMGIDNKAIGNHIHHITHDGIRAISLRNSLIENNIIHNLDDGVDDGDPRGKGWNRHCDGIHVFVPGPGKDGQENMDLTIRGNRIYDCESQGIIFSIYLRRPELHNKRIIVENNIFGPNRALSVNVAGSIDGFIFRHNTFLPVKGGRTFKSIYRELKVGNTSWRVARGCTETYIYNNILTRSPKIQNGYFVSHNLYPAKTKNDILTRFDKFIPEFSWIDAGAMDAKVTKDNPAVNFGTRIVPEMWPGSELPGDLYGTTRDARPDAGAFEFPGLKPKPEDALPRFSGKAKVYVSDFLSGQTLADPYLNGENQKALGWKRPEGLPGWGVLRDTRPRLTMPRGYKKAAYLLADVKEQWQDYKLTMRINNAYNKKGFGTLLRANEKLEGYLVDVAKGRIVLRQHQGGEMVETVLATTKKGFLPTRGHKNFTYVVINKGKSVHIAVDVNNDGTVDLKATDEKGTFKEGTVAIFGHSPNGNHRTDVETIKVELL